MPFRLTANLAQTPCRLEKQKCITMKETDTVPSLRRMDLEWDE